MTNNTIRVQGAREHNLKNISVTMPRDALVVVTGLSGSGKSSLAFDTIYAEGQRRYVESLSAYARQFLEMSGKPDVDSIEGLSPAISIEQKTTSKNPRSTVGTVTEIYDYMRLLWARVGVPYSPATGLPITSQTVSQMVDAVNAMTTGTRLYILAPIVRGRKGEYKKDLQGYRAKGFERAKIDGKIVELSAIPDLDKKKKHDIAIVVDRLVLRDDLGNRLAESIESAARIADGLVVVENADTGQETLFSEKFACPVSGFTLSEIEPRLFSFNSPHGACPKCDGLGEVLTFTPDLVIPNENLSLAEGAVAPWSKSQSKFYLQTLEAVVKTMKGSMTKPWRSLPHDLQQAVLYGTDDSVTFHYEDGLRSYKTTKPFEGVINNLSRRFLETDSNMVREDLSRYQMAIPCETCTGARLKPEALCVRIADSDIAAACQLSIEQALKWFAAVAKKLTPKQNEIAARILKEIGERLTFLNNVGLGYLTLARASATLSGGESQRIRLASQIGSGLTGVLYVLDEPSIGLHQRDNNRLLTTLKRLRDLGNTVLVVEHDEDAIRAADWLIDIGPGAGVHGGEIVAIGTPEQVFANKKSITADYMMGRRSIPVPAKRRAIGKNKIELNGATGNNLQNVNLTLPLGTFTCVTGVSGSGKSTLVLDTLYRAVARALNDARDIPTPYTELLGLHHIDKVIDIDQSPIGRTPRSNPATYTGAFGPIRDWYAGLPESKARGYGPGRFSFNVKGGRCEACEGDGLIKIEMHFLPDVYVQCDVCKGKRYNRETLDVTYRGLSIADVLAMPIEQAAEFFQAIPSIRDKLETLKTVGLGYVQLGQNATTLSGGEAQRVKLSKELARRATGRTLYILDEPTTGLHFEDVKKLLEVLHTLVDQGNTVLVIEHNLDVIKTADWVVDIGPEGGTGGGRIVAQGTPEDLAVTSGSHTGQYLAPLLVQTAKVEPMKKKKRA